MTDALYSLNWFWVINPSSREFSCLAARLPQSGFKPEGYSSNSQLTHTLTSRALPGIVLRISHLVPFAHRWCMTHCTCPCLSASAACVTGDAHGVTTDNVLQSECDRCRNDHAVVFRASSLRGSLVFHQTQELFAQGLPCSTRSC